MSENNLVMNEKKKRTALWGAGILAEKLLKKKVFYADYEIVCIADNDPNKWGMMLRSYSVISPTRLGEMRIDVIIICSNYISEIKRQITADLAMEIDSNSIISYLDVEKQLTCKLCNIYRDSDDPEIRRITDDYKKNGFNVYGFYRPGTRVRYDVFRDEDKWPYVIFENKRMYYPFNHIFDTDSDGEYVEDILYEQQEGSPHLYIREDRRIIPDSVIVDAGVCEGNFALRYIDDAKKVYLIEADEEWCEALERTFAPYNDKVVLCRKYLGGTDTGNIITLDSLISERIDFLKMDIEGAEVEALYGAERTLKESNTHCAICSYHRFGDEEKIRRILGDYGYNTSVSEGYMFFVFDDAMPETMDFRRGIVYGEKCIK